MNRRSAIRNAIGALAIALLPEVLRPQEELVVDTNTHRKPDIELGLPPVIYLKGSLGNDIYLIREWHSNAGAVYSSYNSK